MDNSLDACEEAGHPPRAAHRGARPGPGGRSPRRPSSPRAKAASWWSCRTTAPASSRRRCRRSSGSCSTDRSSTARNSPAASRASASPPPPCTASSPPASPSASRAAWARGRHAHVFDIQLDTRKNEPVVTHDEDAGRSGTRTTGRASSWRSWPTGSRANASSTATSSTPRSPTRTPPSTTRGRWARPSARARDRARQRDADLPARHHRAAQGSRSRSSRIRTAWSWARSCSWPGSRRATTCAASCRRASAACRRQAASDILSKVPWGKKAVAPARARREPRDGGRAAQGHRGDEAHEPAHELPQPHRRRADAQGPGQLPERDRERGRRRTTRTRSSTSTRRR